MRVFNIVCLSAYAAAKTIPNEDSALTINLEKGKIFFTKVNELLFFQRFQNRKILKRKSPKSRKRRMELQLWHFMLLQSQNIRKEKSARQILSSIRSSLIQVLVNLPKKCSIQRIWTAKICSEKWLKKAKVSFYFRLKSIYG